MHDTTRSLLYRTFFSAIALAGLSVSPTVRDCRAQSSDASASALPATEEVTSDYRIPRAEVIPLPDHQTSLTIDGQEKIRWHFGKQYPRPFFYPFLGPSGQSLTRMGHPGAENHDHHRSIWFANNKIEGIDFWSDRTTARIRQKHWYSYGDGDEESVMAVALGWYDDAGVEILQQDVIAALRPLEDGEVELELQLAFRCGPQKQHVEFEQTNFGFLAVRVAKSLSAHFGGGELTNSDGLRGEKAIFGKAAQWMDYSGPIAAGKGRDRTLVREGITYFDHPGNPRYPTHWHVRQDGWMGASFCMQEPYQLEVGKPLVLRYLLYAHRGGHDTECSEEILARFSQRQPFVIRKSTRSHQQYETLRLAPVE